MTEAKAKDISKIKNANIAEFRLWDSRGPTDYVYLKRDRKMK